MCRAFISTADMRVMNRSSSSSRTRAMARTASSSSASASIWFAAARSAWPAVSNPPRRLAASACPRAASASICATSATTSRLTGCCRSCSGDTTRQSTCIGAGTSTPSRSRT